MEKEELKITSNVVSEERFKQVANLTLQFIANSLKKSLGYYGSNTIIENKIDGAIATKDGYTILQYMKFENPIAVVIYDLIRKISFNLVQTVGDGSTSSVIIAAQLFDLIQSSDLPTKYPMKEIVAALNLIKERIEEELEMVATPITDDNFEVIKNIATVSNNNDEIVGENIYNIYKEIKTAGFIYLENSHDNKDHYEFINGIEISSGMISDDFSNNKNKPEFIAKEPFILMCDDRLDSTDLNFMVETIGNLVSRHTRPVVIIAKSFSVEFVSCWVINKNKNPNFQICLVDHSFANKNQENIFNDIAIYTGSTIFRKSELGNEAFLKDPSSVYKMLGSCDQIKITNKTTKIIGMKGNEADLNDRISFIEEQIEEMKKSNDDGSLSGRIFQHEKRIANLKSMIVRYYVGGETEFEKNNRKYLLEDSVYACKSALLHGYVCGGNLSIPTIIEENSKRMYTTELERDLLNLIKESFVQCFVSVLDNKFNDRVSSLGKTLTCIQDKKIYNLKIDDYEDQSKSSIVNSVETEVKILEAVISIISLLATSNQFIGKAF